MVYWKKRVGMGIVMVSLFLGSIGISYAAGVTFSDAAGAKKDFIGKDLKVLKAKCVLPKKLSKYEFDQVDVFLTLSHLDVKGVIYYDKGSVPATWLDSNTIEVDLIKPDGTGDFADGSGQAYGLSDFTTVPQRQKVADLKVGVMVKIFQKTGTGKYDSRWNKATQSWETAFIPDFGGGTVLCEGETSVKLDKLSGAVDDKGILMLPIPGEKWSSYTDTISGGTGDRRQYPATGIRNDACKIVAFTMEIPRFKEDFPDTYNSVKQDLACDYEDREDKPAKRMDLGWTYFIPGAAYAKDAGSIDYKPENYKAVWSPAKVAGLNGEKCMVVTEKGKRPVYLAVQEPYIVVAFLEHGETYSDANSGEDRPYSEKQLQEMESQADAIVADIKVLKGTPNPNAKPIPPRPIPAVEATPAAPAPAAEAKQEAPATEAAPAPTTAPAPQAEAAPAPAPTVSAAINVGDVVQVLWQDKWWPAAVLEVKDGTYKIHYDGYESSWDEWVGTDRIKKE